MILLADRSALCDIALDAVLGADQRAAGGT
jgi:hypothetical protein